MYGIVYENIKKPRVILAASAETLAAHADKNDLSAFFVANEDDMKAVPGSVLVALYNLANAEKDPIKKFENKTIAMRRVFMVLRDLAKVPTDTKLDAEDAGEDNGSEDVNERNAAASTGEAAETGASPDAAKAKPKKGKKAKAAAPAGNGKIPRVAIPAGSRYKGAFKTARAPAHARNWPKSAATPVAPRDGTKGAITLDMLRKGTTYEKIRTKFDWKSQGVSDVLCYLRRCGYGIATDDAGKMTIIE